MNFFKTLFIVNKDNIIKKNLKPSDKNVNHIKYEIGYKKYYYFDESHNKNIKI